MSADKMSVPFFRASLGQEEKDAVLRVLESGWLTTGSEALLFEREFAELTGAGHALAVSSNTSGMILAMEACGVRQGTSVITTPYTFVSTASSARHLGAHVIFADTEPGTYSIDPEHVERILSGPEGKSVAAVVPVHIAGNVCDMERIVSAARKHSVRVIEDCAHSFPSRTKSGYAGTLGDAGVFSFYATKTITTGEGGMVTTDDGSIAERISSMRLHGMSRNAWDRYTAQKASWEYDITAPGYKSNLPDILACIGRAQLRRAHEFYHKRKALAERYNESFREMDFIDLPPDAEGNAWHLYLMRLNLDRLKCTRGAFAQEMQEAGVGISVHFIPLFHFTYWKNLYPGLSARDFPNAEQQFSRTISIPLWPDMTHEMQDHVIQTVRALGEKYHA